MLVNISGRRVDLKEEMNELKANNLRYEADNRHTQQEKAAHALRQDQLLLIKEELSNMMKRPVHIPVSTFRV
jgi:hypothetical protein